MVEPRGGSGVPRDAVHIANILREQGAESWEPRVVRFIRTWDCVRSICEGGSAVRMRVGETFSAPLALQPVTLPYCRVVTCISQVPQLLEYLHRHVAETLDKTRVLADRPPKGAAPAPAGDAAKRPDAHVNVDGLKAAQLAIASRLTTSVPRKDLDEKAWIRRHGTALAAPPRPCVTDRARISCFCQTRSPRLPPALLFAGCASEQRAAPRRRSSEPYAADCGNPRAGRRGAHAPKLPGAQRGAPSHALAEPGLHQLSLP